MAIKCSNILLSLLNEIAICYHSFKLIHCFFRSFRKKCQGRLRKHLADLCLQAGLPGEAILHYETAIDILRPVNDALWIGGLLKF